MSYDDKFFKRYEEYINERTVRRNHNFAFDVFHMSNDSSSLDVVDLGCGVGEYMRFGSYDNYLGVDLTPRVDEDYIVNYANVEKRDWRTLLVLEPRFDAFVSVFSIECMLPQKQAYEHYACLFKNNPNIQTAMVSGFYYEGQECADSVTETGGITSYQTNSLITDFKMNDVEETRLTMRTPSKMFGDNVVEVWKFFKRTY